MVIGVPQELVLAQQYLYRAFKAQTLCVWLKNRGRVLVLNAKPQQDYRHTMKDSGKDNFWSHQARTWNSLSGCGTIEQDL